MSFVVSTELSRKGIARKDSVIGITERLGDFLERKINANALDWEHREESSARFTRNNREMWLNTLAPYMAALGSEAARERLVAIEEHSVVEVARQLKSQYRIDDFEFGTKFDEAMSMVKRKPGPKTNNSKSVVLRDVLSTNVVRVDKRRYDLKPQQVSELMSKGRIKPVTGATLLLAHELAKASVVLDRMNESGKELYRSYDAARDHILGLVAVGRAVVQGDLSEKAMLDVEAMVSGAKKKRIHKAIYTLLATSTVLMACMNAGGIAPADSSTPDNSPDHAGNSDEVVTPTFTPEPIIIPVVTLSAPTSIVIGDPLPQMDISTNPVDVPVGSRAVVDTHDQASVLRDIGLVVVSGVGVPAFEADDGKQYFPVLDQISGGENAIPLTRGKIDNNGVVTYRSDDGTVVEKHLFAFDCPEGEACFEAISYNEDDTSLLYLVRVDKQTGQVLARVLTGDAGAAVSAGKPIPWEEGPSEYWHMVVTGDAALQRMDGVTGLSYENGQLKFVDIFGDKHETTSDNISYYPGFGGVAYVNGEQGGWFHWDELNNDWIKMNPAETVGVRLLSHNEAVYEIEGKYAIATDHMFMWITNIEEVDGKTIAILEDGSQMRWGDQGWEPNSGLSPEQIAANVAETNADLEGAFTVDAEGGFYKIDPETGKSIAIPEFGYRVDTNDITWTHYSELLGRELIEPVADFHLVRAQDPATGKSVLTGEFSIQGCNFDGKQCKPDMVLDPVTGKEVAQAHSIFEVMMLQLEDMKRMSEQDKIDAYDFSQKHFDKLLNPNHGSRSIRFVDERGIEHTWLLYFPAGEGRYAGDWSNQVIVRDRGILRGVPYFIFAGIDRGETGFVVWEVGAGTDNLVRREIFIDQRSITNFNIYDESQWTFMVDEEWLPEEYELLPFD